MQQEFENVVSRNGGGEIVVDLSRIAPAETITIITGGEVQLKAPKANNEPDVTSASADKRAYNIGDVLPDGWIVGPVSPTTGKPMAIEPLSGALEGYQTWDKGEEHAEMLRSQGHEGARLPDMDELRALYNGVVKAGRNQNARFNRSLSIFRTRESSPHAIYWSSTPESYNSTTHTWIQSFHRGGYMAISDRDEAAACVRCVRDEPNILLPDISSPTLTSRIAQFIEYVID